MIWLYLKHDVIGSCSKKVYGKKNDRIHILKNNHEMILVQHENGSKFFIKESDYSTVIDIINPKLKKNV
jgi:hypothetical protein